MKNLKIKVIVGYRKDQQYTVDADEAHKAYYLFLNPEKRGVFNSGLALQGKDIKAIEPDYHSTMGWNPTHQLDSNDWNEIHRLGVHRDLESVLMNASEVAKGDPEALNTPLTQLISEAPKNTHFLEGKNDLVKKLSIKNK